MHAAVFRSLAFALVLSLPLGSQGKVWVVDDDGGVGIDFTHPQDAIDAAASGDVILMKAGTYPVELSSTFELKQFRIEGKALTVTAEEGANVTLMSMQVDVVGLAAGESVTLRGITAIGCFVTLENNEGPLWIEDCTIRPIPDPGILSILKIHDCGFVTVIRSKIVGTTPSPFSLTVSTPGIKGTLSDIYVYDSDIVGGGGKAAAPDGAAAAEVSGGTFFTSGSTYTGGPAFTGSGGFDGFGAILTGDQNYALDSTFTGVLGTLTTLSGPARHFEASSPVREGSQLTMTVAGEQGDVVFVAFSISAGELFLPGLSGVSLLGLPAAAVLTPGTLGAGGTLQFGLTVPALPASLQGIDFRAQPIVVTGTGSFSLLPGSTLTVLDDAL